MNNSTLMLMLIIIALGTFFLRFSFIFLYGKLTLPLWMHRSMRFVPAAVLAALIFPAIMIQSGQLDLSLGNSRFMAGTLAMFVSWRSKNLLATIAVGLISFWILQAF